MEFLLCLAQHPGKTLSKDQLFQAVWPKIIVTEDVLKRCIAELRRAFNDDARNPHMIETIAKRGYRLLAPVSAPASATAPALPQRAVTDSIVVLPFANMSADPENEYFADGITEEIIDALAQVPGLRVVARSSAFSFKGKHIDLRIAGEQLKVRTVLEGSVRRADNRVRITAQLVSTADGYHLWSERHDREIQDVFAIQEEIAQAIAQRLKTTFPWHGKPLVKTGTPNLEAYQSYLKERALHYKRSPAISRAVLCCQRAVDLDPNYALAWTAVADCYTLLSWYGLAVPRDFMPRAMEAARRAEALDASLAEAHSALASISFLYNWDRAEAEREFARSIQLNPNDTQALSWYGCFYLQLSEGRLMEGMEHVRLALASDPLSGYVHAVYAWVDEADAIYREMQARARRQYIQPTLLAFAAAGATREDEAIRHAREACEIHDPNFQTFFFPILACVRSAVPLSALSRDRCTYGAQRPVAPSSRLSSRVTRMSCSRRPHGGSRARGRGRFGAGRRLTCPRRTHGGSTTRESRDAPRPDFSNHLGSRYGTSAALRLAPQLSRGHRPG